MPVSIQEMAIENEIRRGQRGREALAVIGVEPGTSPIDAVELGFDLELGEQHVRNLPTFTWPNIYQQGTEQYELYGKIVASKRQAAIQRLA